MVTLHNSSFCKTSIWIIVVFLLPTLQLLVLLLPALIAVFQVSINTVKSDSEQEVDWSSQSEMMTSPWGLGAVCIFFIEIWGMNWKHLMKLWCKRGWAALLEALLARLHSCHVSSDMFYQNKTRLMPTRSAGQIQRDSGVFSSLGLFSIPLTFILTKDFNQFRQTSQAHSLPFGSTRLILPVIHHVRNQQHHSINISM